MVHVWCVRGVVAGSCFRRGKAILKGSVLPPEFPGWQLAPRLLQQVTPAPALPLPAVMLLVDWRQCLCCLLLAAAFAFVLLQGL